MTKDQFLALMKDHPSGNLNGGWVTDPMPWREAERLAEELGHAGIFATVSGMDHTVSRVHVNRKRGH